MIELGDRVKDEISGVRGVAIAVTFWLHGCKRWVVQPEESKDGKPADTISVDEPQLTVLKKGVVAPTGKLPPPEASSSTPRRHGPMPNAQRHSNVSRR